MSTYWAASYITRLVDELMSKRVFFSFFSFHFFSTRQHREVHQNMQHRLAQHFNCLLWLSSTCGSNNLMSPQTDRTHMRRSGRARLVHHTQEHKDVSLNNHMHISWCGTSKMCLLLAHSISVVSYPQRLKKEACSVGLHPLCYGSTQTAEESCLQQQSLLSYTGVYKTTFNRLGTGSLTHFQQSMLQYMNSRMQRAGN